jgi:integrase
MSVYFVKVRGWRYDFTLKGTRHTGAWFKTKREAQQAEAKRREEIETPRGETEILTDMGFLELANRRLDHVKAYNTKMHYDHHVYLFRRLIRAWGTEVPCAEITTQMVEEYLFKRLKVSPGTANKDLRLIRAFFNFGKKKGLIDCNPSSGIEFFPIEEKEQYTPPKRDVLSVLLAADPDTQDYLWTIALTLARKGEIDRLKWKDVDFERHTVTLYTRKKKGGNLRSRKIPMVPKLYGILSRRYDRKDPAKPWVFWHTFWSSKSGERKEGPYQDRKRVMRTLCRKAGVKYFRFHALRHFGASLLADAGIPMVVIQRLLGHENIETTELYLHAIGAAERDAMDILEKVTTELDSEGAGEESDEEVSHGFSHK